MKRIKRWLKWGFLWLLLAGFLYFCWLFAQVVWWNYANPHETAVMAERLAAMREKDPKATLQQTWVPYERISKQLKRAVVAAEDDRFLDHGGFDWNGMTKALEKNLKRGKTVAGGSTISQQLAKNLFLSSRRSYTRKAEEAIITVMIETVWSKERILEVYLNVAEWGDGIFGAEAAARHYYGVNAAQLDAQQAARLAVMLPNPRRYQKIFPPRLEAHAQRIEKRMQMSVVP
ncbi:MAG: monofunctional biosynthetic peptidoglycan transglycosylase [Proteobacteria bacterium]|nr:monofunctional biosynthetic peptidoglycan transglycosylase [Pseudomonadota bacterium]MCL2309103.1 monofunctional biosynthetic peptidoglycan transglycosylase [Pseudomonadota bacterium]